MIIKAIDKKNKKIYIYKKYVFIYLSKIEPKLKQGQSTHMLCLVTCLLKYRRKRHDHQVVQKLNWVLKLKEQCTRTVENITFFRNCLESFVTPVYIQQRVSKAKPKNPWAIEQAFLRDDIYKYQDVLTEQLMTTTRHCQWCSGNYLFSTNCGFVSC